MRIGLIADTHDDIVPSEAIAARLSEVFARVELILHCGDITTNGMLDSLEEIAPVVAVRSAADPPAQPPRLLDGPHCLEVGGVVIGLVTTLTDTDPASLFARPIDVVVHGGTHEANVVTSGPMLSVNPGSPTLANVPTVALLEVAGGRARATLISMG